MCSSFISNRQKVHIEHNNLCFLYIFSGTNLEFLACWSLSLHVQVLRVLQSKRSHLLKQDLFHANISSGFSLSD